MTFLLLSHQLLLLLIWRRIETVPRALRNDLQRRIKTRIWNTEANPTQEISWCFKPWQKSHDHQSSYPIYLCFWIYFARQHSKSTVSSLCVAGKFFFLCVVVVDDDYNFIERAFVMTVLFGCVCVSQKWKSAWFFVVVSRVSCQQQYVFLISSSSVRSGFQKNKALHFPPKSKDRFSSFNFF